MGKTKNYRELGYKAWERNFYNAKRFFNSKGNVKTKAKIKAKWFKDFKEDLLKIEEYWKSI